MGLDLTIYEEKNFGKDEKGRTTYTMVELENFRNDVGRTIMDYVGDLSSMSNCSTVAVDGIDFIEGLKSMKKDKATIEKIIELKNNNEAILTYLNVKDTIKIKDNDKYKTLKRDDLIAASTPQCASKEIFLEVY